MRLLLKLRSLKNCEYDLMYFTKLQGFVYNLMRGNGYDALHDKRGYKFFCFSNVFPLNIKNKIIEPIKQNELKNLLVSSPDSVLIKLLKVQIESKIKENGRINIGEMSFSIEDARLIEPKLKSNCTIISAAPIIIRIPRMNYEKYCISSEKDYVFWRAEYDFSVFVKQLEENLFKKYKEFCKTDIEEFPIFEQFKYIKPTYSHVVIEGREQMLVGSVWEFMFSAMYGEKRKLLEFSLDAGFGERNSLGFGFMNEKSSRWGKS